MHVHTFTHISFLTHQICVVLGTILDHILVARNNLAFDLCISLHKAKEKL